MTIGSKTYDYSSVFTRTSTDRVGTITVLGTAPTGYKSVKSWSGSDWSQPLDKSYETRWMLGSDEKWIEYRRRVKPPKRAKIEDHPYTMSLVTTKDQPLRWKQVEANLTTIVEIRDEVFSSSVGSGYGIVSSSTWNANDDIALAGKLREKIAGSDFNAGVSLGESREALGMIFNSASRIRDALVCLKRGYIEGVFSSLGITAPRRSFSDLKKSPKEFGSLWLEVQYGWLPLLKDAEGAAQFLAKQLEFPSVQTYKVRKKKALEADVTPLVRYGGNYDFVGNTTGQYIARLKEVNVVSLSGLLDPLSVAWELVPYSFVVDWFIPIGNYLSARGLAQSVTGTFVKTITRRERFQCGSIGFNSPYKTMLVQPNYLAVKVSMDRTVSTNLSIPKPQIKSLGEIASWKRSANAVALLTQLVLPAAEERVPITREFRVNKAWSPPTRRGLA